MICSECGRDWPEDRFNPDSRTPTVCFSCRVHSVNIGIPHREHFHNFTDKEAQRRIIAEAKSNGHDPVPKTTTYAGPVSI